ncbi:MAG: sulfurtransferase [Peptostreptococcaceae bacterium]
MKNLVTTNWLKENINNDNIVIIDCRFDLMDKEYGRKTYEKAHIKGAQRIDIETQLSTVVEEHGGRHPLPSIEELEETFKNIGINNDSIVVSYDEGDLAGASRLWWILKYLGHEEIYVLDGGIELFEKLGGETTTHINEINKGNFTAKVNGSMRVDMYYVKERINNEKVALIDSREFKRYIGEFEPVDKKAGHIPGAQNYFWMNILQKEDDILTLKNSDDLKVQFESLSNYEEVIVYCGSGITACPNSLALNEVGINHKVYAGSFSDWISYSDNKVETNLD